MNTTKLSSQDVTIGLDGVTVGDFWSWAYSDILSNRNRSVFAEFLVGTALNVTDKPRIEWDAVDLRYGDRKIEVKSAAYVQSWKQAALSTISFDIGMKESWDAVSATFLREPIRSADCYVFCLYAEKDTLKVNVLNVAHWHFFVILTEQINQAFGNQKSVRLSRIQSLCQPVDYHNLRDRVNRVLGSAT
jgi:hypothetical protein